MTLAYAEHICLLVDLNGRFLTELGHSCLEAAHRDFIPVSIKLALMHHSDGYKPTVQVTAGKVQSLVDPRQPSRS